MNEKEIINLFIFFSVHDSFSQLLDCFVIPVVLLLSWFFLLVRYKTVHFVGTGLCLLGIGCIVGADILLGGQQGFGKYTLSSTHKYLKDDTQQIYIWLQAAHQGTDPLVIWYDKECIIVAH